MKNLRIAIAAILVLFLFADTVCCEVRLKDVARVRDQQAVKLIGEGLVVGLSGTGDGRNTQFTIRMIGNMLKRMGLEVPSTTIKVKNVAAVIITAEVSPYVKEGGTFDVIASSMGDATSLEGGTLLVTLLKDINGDLFGKAQGQVSMGGTNKNFGSAQRLVNNAQLVGIVPGGGILERGLPTLAMDEQNLLVTLLNPDFTTAYRLAEAVNEVFETDLAKAQDAGSIVLEVPEIYAQNNDIVKFISEIEDVSFIPDNRAQVIINERTGTIVAGGKVTLGPVAISHGTLSLSIGDPNAGAQQPAMQGQAPQGDRIVTIDETVDIKQNNLGEIIIESLGNCDWQELAQM